MKPKTLAATALSFFLLNSACGEALTHFTLMTPDGDGSSYQPISQPWSMNSNGQIAGANLAAGYAHATLWSAGATIDLSTLTTQSSVAYGINNGGQMVGETQQTTRGLYRATLWQDGVAVDLGTLGGLVSSARAINEAGQVIGWSQTTNNQVHATLWSNGAAIDLGALGGTYGVANGINKSAHIVGVSTTSDSQAHATLWHEGDATVDLGTLGGTFSEAADINDSGLVVGRSTTNLGALHATLWRNGVANDLSAPGSALSWAWAINNAGQIVGATEVSDQAFAPSMHATLWSNGKPVDLNDLLDGDLKSAGWVLSHAWDINDKGWIIGSAHNQVSGRNSGFLMTVSSVPEPDGIVLTLVGIGVSIFVRRVRRVPLSKCGN